MPASRVFFLAALTTLLVVVAVVRPGLGPLVLDGAIVLAFAVDLARVRGAAFSVERHWPQILVQGVEAEVRLELVSASRRPLRSLGRSPQRFQGLGTELYALREYLPGDPLRP